MSRRLRLVLEGNALLIIFCPNKSQDGMIRCFQYIFQNSDISPTPFSNSWRYLQPDFVVKDHILEKFHIKESSIIFYVKWTSKIFLVLSLLNMDQIKLEFQVPSSIMILETRVWSPHTRFFHSLCCRSPHIVQNTRLETISNGHSSASMHMGRRSYRIENPHEA